ncbi:MAG TPA: FAD-linked oxidase C-terminal domain-containing protein, partial [Egibacteraceae bacterium]|nr:FAD-linked oxidase C-terminal domain-containing protein [Egibacteraceae bacterium]
MPPVPLSSASTRRGSRRAERWEGDARRLERALRAAIEGDVRFDAGARGAYATDASNYRQVPIGVVAPRSADDVLAALAACRDIGAPVLSRGAGTSLAGQCCNVALVLDFSRYLNNVLDVDADARLARVEPGVVLDDLNRSALRRGLRFAPDPATHSRCTIGGMIGNNACGVRSLKWGKTVDNVHALQVATYDGAVMDVGATSPEQLARIIAGSGRQAALYTALRDLRDVSGELVRSRFPRMPRRVSGYNLDQLLDEAGFHVARALVGTEGTCAAVLEATVELVIEPAARAMVVLAFPDIIDAADAVPQVLEHDPSGLEGIDATVIASLARKAQHAAARRLLPAGGGWLLVELDGDDAYDVQQRAQALAAQSPPQTSLVLLSPDGQQDLWRMREAGLAAAAHSPGQPMSWSGWEDSAVAPELLGGYLRDLRELLGAYGYTGSIYGHFGDGCLHTRTDFDLRTTEGVARFRGFIEQAADLVTSHGGSLSGEHGDGQARGELLDVMFGPELVDMFRRFKAAWDPGGGMNPGKVIDAAPLDADLRLGDAYRPWEPATRLAFREDGGSLSRATLRCVGVGECRKTTSGVMCPSFMATRDEIHSTRGRARLLFEMLEGDPVRGGWRDEHVEDALSLCLSCKACKTECPVGVDMAAYKAEFLSHRYEGRIRPAAAYSIGLIPFWARLASRAPGLANRALGAPGIGPLLKRLAGIHSRRRPPRFAAQTLSRSLGSPPAAAGGRPVALWLDTFVEHFQPEVGRAALTVLTAAGNDVHAVRGQACCGRPLYEFGMLDAARRFLERALDALEPSLAEGAEVVVLEPSCAAMFRDELGELLPRDGRVKLLARRTVTLAELLIRNDYSPPPLDREIIVQRHCHSQAVIGYDADAELLSRLGAQIEVLDSGCCGMAGSFGYERGKYDVSVAIAERALIPAVRAAQRDTLILADGFSCRSQIADLAGREAL